MMRRINCYLNPMLTDLCQQRTLINELNTLLPRYIPSTLAPHCQVGSFQRGCLTLIADDAANASQLRYTIPELRDNLRREAGIYQLSSIKIVLAEKPPSPKRTSKLLSKKAREAIITGSQLCQHQPLKEALQRLAKNIE